MTASRRIARGGWFALCLALTNACAPEPEPAAEPHAPPPSEGQPIDAGADPPSEPEQPPPPPVDDEVPITTVLLIPGTTIPGSFFDDMAARLASDGFDPVIYEPPDLLTDGLVLGAQRIADVVDARLAETGEPRLHIVAECNGGVATRYYLQALAGHEHVAQVVTFVSAHNGTWLSPLGQWVTGFQSLDDVVPTSAFLADLDARPFPADLKLTSIYSCNDEFMLPYDTSVVPGATNVLFCQHYLKHFDGFWDPLVYQRILVTLEGHGDTAPTVY